MNKRTVVGGLIILMVMAFAIYQGTGIGRNWKAVPVPTVSLPKITPVPTIDVTKSLEVFQNSKFKYSIMKPVGWAATAITSDKNFDDRQVFLPDGGLGVGTVVELSITVVSKPEIRTEIATDADWSKWLESPTGATDSSGLVKKYGEKMVDGKRAVVLWQNQDLPDGYDWSILTWVRKGQVNYYIDALGVGGFSDNESRLFDYISGSFTAK